MQNFHLSQINILYYFTSIFISLYKQDTVKSDLVYSNMVKMMIKVKGQIFQEILAYSLYNMFPNLPYTVQNRTVHADTTEN